MYIDILPIRLEIPSWCQLNVAPVIPQFDAGDIAYEASSNGLRGQSDQTHRSLLMELDILKAHQSSRVGAAFTGFNQWHGPPISRDP